jgi:hypothetical protein
MTFFEMNPIPRTKPLCFHTGSDTSCSIRMQEGDSMRVVVCQAKNGDSTIRMHVGRQKLELNETVKPLFVTLSVVLLLELISNYEDHGTRRHAWIATTADKNARNDRKEFVLH